jgi:Uri superfamily endonuclease
VSAGGTYALLLRLDAPRVVRVGALGELDFPSGWYLYLGSALGPGGLAARLARHKRHADKRLHWHIDYVRAVMTLVEVWTEPGDVRQECGWAAAAAELPEASIIAPRLGASDCRCPSHLYYYARRPQLEQFAAAIQTELIREIVDDAD